MFLSVASNKERWRPSPQKCQLVTSTGVREHSGRFILTFLGNHSSTNLKVLLKVPMQWVEGTSTAILRCPCSSNAVLVVGSGHCLEYRALSEVTSLAS